MPKTFPIDYTKELALVDTLVRDIYVMMDKGVLYLERERLK